MPTQKPGRHSSTVRHTKMLQKNTNVLFAKRYLETAVSENYVEWALELLEQGQDSPSLRILAGLFSPFNSFEVQDYFERSLKELHVDEPKESDAINSYSIYLCERIISGNIETISGMEALYRICIHLDYRGDYIVWLELSDAVLSIKYGETPYTYSSMKKDNIDKIILNEATNFLKYLRKAEQKL